MENISARSATIMREDVFFESQGERVAACHYFPVNTTQSDCPAVVMGHGLSLTRDCGLRPYAESFAAAGMHVITFDYRGFGNSEGKIRELISVKMQVQDYLAALSFTRSLRNVDVRRIALWGTSYSGGIATQCAYEDGNVQALVIQVPNLDNAATGLFMAKRFISEAPMRGLWLAGAAIRDAIAALFNGKPVYVQAMGRPGEMAAYTSDEAMDVMEQIKGVSWNNRLAPRDFISLPFRPIQHIKSIQCPIQIFAADNDDLTPATPAHKAAKIAGSRGELHCYPIGHFGVYVGDTFIDVLGKQTAFLEKHLTLA